MTANFAQLPERAIFSPIDTFITDISNGETVEHAFSTYRERKVKEAWLVNSVLLNHSENAARKSLITDLEVTDEASRFDSRNVLSLNFDPKQTERILNLYLKTTRKSEEKPEEDPQAIPNSTQNIPETVREYFGDILRRSGRKQLLTLLKRTPSQSITPELLQNLATCLRGLASDNAKAKVLRYLHEMSPRKRADCIHKGSLVMGSLTHGKERVRILKRVQDIPREQINNEVLKAHTVLIPNIETSSEGTGEIIKAIRDTPDTQKALLINFVAGMCSGEDTSISDLSESVKTNDFIKAKLIRGFTSFLAQNPETTTMEEFHSLATENADRAMKTVQSAIVLGSFETILKSPLLS